MPSRAKGRTSGARAAVQTIIERFGYLQLDTVSIAGARSHALVLLSRLQGLDYTLAEELLQPGNGLFEYWGHEASWIPMQLYPAFEFRRQEFRQHPWWGDVIAEHPKVTARLRAQIRAEGPLKSVDMEGQGSSGWWELKLAKKIAAALWSCGELAIRKRTNFQRTYDFAENVIPIAARSAALDEDEAIAQLLLKALDGHGWASTATLADTWRLKRRRPQLHRILDTLVEQSQILPCSLQTQQGPKPGWIKPQDLQLAARLKNLSPRFDQGVLLSPFDPVLWDRARVAQLFDFNQVLEIFKPAAQRTYGYFCLPVLAGERLVARVDLKAERKQGSLKLLSCRLEASECSQISQAQSVAAAHSALERYAQAVGLELKGLGSRRKKS